MKRDDDGNILEIKSPHGRKVSILNDSKGRIMRATDDAGHWIIYSYDARDCLIQAMNWRGDVQRFTYNDKLNMVTVREHGPADGKEGPYAFTVENQYDEQNRLKHQEVSNGDVFEAKYTDSVDGKISRTEVRERYGYYTCDFNASGYVVREQYSGLSKAGWTLEYERDNHVNAVVDIKLACELNGRKISEAHLPGGLSLGGTGDAHKLYVFGLCEGLHKLPNSPYRQYREMNKGRRLALSQRSPEIDTPGTQ